MDAAVVIPNWNGREWLAGCLDSVARQTLAPSDVVLVDNGSTDGSRELAAASLPGIRILDLGRNTGFAHAANRGVDTVGAEAVALVNTDVVLAPDWLERVVGSLERHPDAASVACKMLDLRDPSQLYSAGDRMRRDGGCEQRGRFSLDEGQYDQPGEVFSACAGAALYRREPFLALGGFDERFFTYFEDVDLGMRLGLAGWSCRYEPAVAHHAGEGSAHRLDPPPATWIERNMLLLVAKTFPLRWLPAVLYRQTALMRDALRAGNGRAHIRGALAAIRLLPDALRERRALRRTGRVAVDELVPAHPLRGPLDL